MPGAHVEALAQLRPYTAVGLLRQVIPRACGRLAEAVLGRGAQHKHRHTRCLEPGAERVQSASRARAERVQSACRARAERVQSACRACRALQSACRQLCALAKPISRPVFLRMAFSIASLFLKRSVDSLVITTILRPSACSRRSTACGCSRRGLTTRGGSRGGAHLASGVSPRYGSSAPAGGMGARLRLRGLRERL